MDRLWSLFIDITLQDFFFLFFSMSYCCPLDALLYLMLLEPVLSVKCFCGGLLFLFGGVTASKSCETSVEDYGSLQIMKLACRKVWSSLVLIITPTHHLLDLSCGVMSGCPKWTGFSDLREGFWQCMFIQTERFHRPTIFMFSWSLVWRTMLLHGGDHQSSIRGTVRVDDPRLNLWWFSYKYTNAIKKVRVTKTVPVTSD